MKWRAEKEKGDEKRSVAEPLDHDKSRMEIAAACNGNRKKSGQIKSAVGSIRVK